MSSDRTEVLIVGGGNAALCAALAARERGVAVTVLEAAPFEERGGNTWFTAGAMRVVYDGVDDLKQLVPDLTDKEIAETDFGTYPAERFFEDMARVTEYRTDPELAEVLITRSFDTLDWMREQGVRFAPIYSRQAFKVDGRFRFWGGLTVEAVGGGPGLVESLTEACERAGVEIRYGTRAVELHRDGDRVTGATVRHDGAPARIDADAVVLASGGFEADPAWRTQYLGPGWDVAKVRGTRFNDGAGIRMAIDIGASTAGNWSGAHAVSWDMNAPEFGVPSIGDGYSKLSYPFGIMVNADGQRFLDEGADFRNYTYAKYGRRILEQPNQLAYQVFDAQVSHLLRDEYRIREVSVVKADTLEQLAERMEGVDPEGFLATVAAYNDAVDVDTPFDPNVKDGRATRDIAPRKSNWANRLEEPPFEAFQTTCGITFTFGGLRVEPRSAAVLDADQRPIPGLYACGELVGGLFYFNYPGGTGLTSGSVFGRLAGAAAAADINPASG